MSPASESKPDWQETGIAVRAYGDGGRGFEADAQAFARVGFVPTTVTHQPQRPGAWRIFLLGGFFALVWRPPHHLIVTYARR
jgi:hypothetical protein